MSLEQPDTISEMNIQQHVATKTYEFFAYNSEDAFYFNLGSREEALKTLAMWKNQILEFEKE